MSIAEDKFAHLTMQFSRMKTVVAGQMFGKRCLKVQGKAFMALHKESLAFKLSGDAHKKALAVPGATLWDPSGKGRPMKEWVALPSTSLQNAETWAHSALHYVAETAQ